MEFKEYKNAAYWQEQRERRGQVTLPQLIVILTLGFVFYLLCFLAGFIGA